MKKRLFSIILVLVFFIGLSVLLYPTIADYVNSKHASRAIVDYEAILKNLKPEDYTEEFAKADKYNAAIKDVPFPFMYYDKVPDYETTLNVAGTGIIGYISIEKIKVELPVYHGISASTLNRAVGHVPGSSLPAGGAGTHCVLSAHRGLPSAQLFTHLDKLKPGDVFTLTVLDRVLTYEVDQTLIVEPPDVEPLYVSEDEDFCTLVTCTPYGINTHRLLVRGRRIETVYAKSDVYVPSDAYRVDPIIIAPIVAAPMLFVLLIVLMVKYSKKRKPKITAEDFRKRE